MKNVQRAAGHADPSTTNLYDLRGTIRRRARVFFELLTKNKIVKQIRIYIYKIIVADINKVTEPLYHLSRYSDSCLEQWLRDRKYGFFGVGIEEIKHCNNVSVNQGKDLVDVFS